MRFLVLLSSILAASFAAYEPIYKHPGPYAELGPNGIPLETPEVQAAKLAHLAAHATARGLPFAPVGHSYAPGIVAADGTPLDTPEVAAAKADHFAAYNEAAYRNGAFRGYFSPSHHYAASGPVDTPEVQHAKAAHFAAYAQLAGRNAHPYHYRRKRSAYGGPQHLPVLGANGVPLDTPEVQAAKAYHYAALAQAASRQVGYPVYGYGGRYHGALHQPVIGPGGVPVDTPEVQHARAAHFHALANGGHVGHVGHAGHAPHAGYVGAPEFRYSGEYGYADIGHDGQVLETPEVQQAKAAHFAAHEAAYYAHPHPHDYE